MPSSAALHPLTRALCHELYRSWENDPAIYMDMSRFHPYTYDPAAVDSYFDARQKPTRVLFIREEGSFRYYRIDRDREA